MENQQSTVVYLEHALVPQNRVVKAFDRKTLNELAPRWERPYIALVDGKAVLRKDWDITIYEGHAVIFCDARAVPQGFFDSIFKAVLSIAVVAVAVAAPGFGIFAGTVFASGFGAAMLTGAVMFAGMAIVNALLPPALPGTAPQNQLGSPSPTYNLQAQGNYARLEQAIPEHFGRHIVFPDFAAQPYSSAFNNDVFLYQLFCIGRGEYDIEEIRIEDTPIQNFADVTWEIIGPNKPINLFPSNVVTNDEVGGQDLEKDVWVGPFAASDEGTKTQFIGLDFLAPRGLYFLTQDARFLEISVYVKIEARPIDDNGDPLGPWASLVPLKISTKSLIPGVSMLWDRLTAHLPEDWNNKVTGILSGLASFFVYTETIDYEKFTGKSVNPQRFSLKFPVAYPGRYEVRCMRTDTNASNHMIGHDFQWVGLKAFLEGPETFGDTTCVAVAMRSSSQLSGQASRKVNMIATRKLPIWNGSTWSAPTATKSIAWAAAYCCKQIGKTDSEIDLAALQTLDAIWSARGDECNGRVDNFSSFWDALSRICSAGRCKPYIQGGVIRFFRHQPQSIPVAMFSTRNMVSGSFGVEYLLPSPETADAIDVSYFDEDVWKPRRVQAKLPDSSAEKPVKVDVSFITNREKALAEGMYKAGANRLQRKMIRFSTEMDGFIPSFGDLITIQHDMPAWGQGGEVIGYATGSNLLKYSDDYSNISAWASVGSGSGSAPVITRDAGLAPDGTMSADRVDFALNGGTTTGDRSDLYNYANSVSGQSTVNAVWIKTVDGSTKQMRFDFNGTSANYFGDGFSSSNITVNGEWQRFVIGLTSSVDNLRRWILRLRGGVSTSDSASVYVWGAVKTNGDLEIPQDIKTQASQITYANVLQTSEQLIWEEDINHYVALRDKNGSVVGPFAAQRGINDSTIIINGGTGDFAPYTGSEYERTYYTFGPAETWAQKAIVMAVKPRGHYLVDIEAVNEEDGVHTAEDGIVTPPAVTSQLGNYVEAPAVSGLLASPLPTDHTVMLLSWTPAPWADSYLIEASPNGEEWARLGESTSASYTAKAIYGESTIIRVAAVGLSIGAWAQVAYSDMVTSVWDETISGLTLTPNKGMLDISWNASNAWNVAGYELRYGSSWASGTVIVSALQSNAYSWQPVDDGTITIWLKAIDVFGAESSTAASATLSINGPVVSNLSQRVIDNNVLLSWTATPGTFAIAAAEIRRGLDFDTAEVIGRIQGDFTVVFETVAGTYKYWVVLQDIAGIYGPESGIYAIVNQPPDYVLHDQRALALTGTATSALVSGGVLYAPVNTSETFEEHFTDNSYDTPQEQIDDGYPYFLQPAPASGSYVETIDYGATIPSTKITLSLTRRTVAGTVTITPTIETSPDNSTWTTYAGVYETYASNFRYVRVTLEFDTSDGGFEAVSGSMVRLDVKTKKVQGTVSAVSTDSGGTSVDITGQFVDVQSITVSPQGTTAAIAIYDFTDTPNPTSFKVLLFNTSGTRISGTVSYTVQGV